ncbi:flagellar hook-basal body complex protein FliE [Ahrensia sp. R2A130]|uniref:flagellar hook-basal body complex protein FliE n=1 Tax=Ahrensia sp. R2A130 TaxID=744979 RepID=UPI0001E083C6|nr:flagellar hook-basal body complex protein FliE [Ahrensia sp. R2A130]EFL89497.1 flagellar hook-basal body complex protein FliE [Ahrensia sp. R2A130]
MIDPISATAASSAGQTAATALAKPPVTNAPTGISFAEMLGSQAQNLSNGLHGAEAIAAQGMTGETGIRQVADAVMEAERSMQAAVVVRDKIVAAWLDISRMAI